MQDPGSKCFSYGGTGIFHEFSYIILCQENSLFQSSYYEERNRACAPCRAPQLP